jgi:S1-C subfamily serine protease
MHRPTRTTAAALLGATLIGAGAGAGIYSATDSSPRPVPVNSATVTPQPAATKQTAKTASEIFDADNAGVVEITVTTQGNSSLDPFGPSSGASQAQGSGFVLDTQGHIVTNEHVVDGADSVSIKFADGTTRTATVVGTDPSTDLAVLKVDAPASSLHPLTLGDSDAVEVGDPVVAIGSPEGLENSLTTGVVSALHRQITAPNNFTIDDAIQTDAAINHGNSGGVLVNAYGNVIGVTSQIQSQSGGNEGIGFAVPSNTVKSIAAQLISSGKVEHSYLGVGIATIPSSASAQLGVSGAAITQVRAGSPASKAGLQASTGSTTVGGADYPTGGDVITKVDGKSVASAADLQQLIDAEKPGDHVTLTVVRSGKTRTVDVTLGTRPS